MSKYTNYEIHPKADELPMMNDKEFESLKENIKLHGLINPIIIDHKDRIIDGRNRYKACIETDTEPRFITLTNFMKDYEMYLGEYFYDLENQSGNLNKAIEAGDHEKVIEMLITILNVNRRHLSDFESYLSLKQNKELVKQGEIGKNHEKVRELDPSSLKTEEKEKVTLDEAAKELNVSKAKLKRMKYIDQHGSDELKEEVKQGKKSVDKGYNELRAQAKAKQEPKAEPKPEPEPEINPQPQPKYDKEVAPQPKNWFEANLNAESDKYIAKEVHNCAARLINEKGISFAPIVLSWLRKIGRTELFNEIQTWKPEN
jgi:ParB-like chromosome segregation protein Spo0J